MTLLEQLSEAEVAELRGLKQLRLGALVAVGEATLRYDSALAEFRDAGDAKRTARAGFDEISAKIGETVARLAQEKGIRENIEIDLNALP